MEKLNLKVAGNCIINKDFEGSRTAWGKDQRSFAIVLDKQKAYELAEEGWNVKMTNNTFNINNFIPLYYLPVKIRFGVKILDDPVIIIRTNDVIVELGDNNCSVLDWSEFKDTVEIEINGYYYANGDFQAGTNCFGFQNAISATLSRFVATVKGSSD